jgi:NRPS condensation-like uncharacterized protein
MFRLSAVLSEPIHIDRLNQALCHICERFPYYMVNLSHGAFWYSFVNNPRKPSVEIDSRYPCTSMPIKQRGVFPFRVRAWNRTVSVEFSHALTDGTGATVFLKSLIASYYLEASPPGTEERKRTEALFREDKQILFGEDTADPEESEDGFRRYFSSDIPGPKVEKKVFHLPGKRLKTEEYRVITAEMDIEPVLTCSRNEGVSLTEYLTAVYFHALQAIQKQHLRRKKRKRWKPLSVMVPVNLRTILPSKTMRNFFLTINPQLDTRLGFYSFSEICFKVHYFIKSQLDQRQLKQYIKRNVSGVIHPLLRIAPLFVKNMVIRTLYRRYGENCFSGSLSNLGIFTLPAFLEERVEKVMFIPPPSPVLGVKCGAISYKNRLYLSFGSLVRDRVLEYYFITFLRKSGILVSLSGNWKKGENSALLFPLRG